MMANPNMTPPLPYYNLLLLLGLEDNDRRSSIWSTHLVHSEQHENISEYHIGEIHFLLVPHPFQPFRLVPLVKRWPCFGFLNGCDFSLPIIVAKTFLMFLLTDHDCAFSFSGDHVEEL